MKNCLSHIAFIFANGNRDVRAFLPGILQIMEKTRQNAKIKQTFYLTGKIEINEKTRQNAEDK